MILKLEIMQLQRGVATPACERQNEPPSLTAFAKADKRQLYVARYILCKTKKYTSGVSSHSSSRQIPFYSICMLFLYFGSLFETAKFDGSQLPQKH